MILKIILTVFALTLSGYIIYTYVKAEGTPQEKIKNVLDHTIQAGEGK